MSADATVTLSPTALELYHKACEADKAVRSCALSTMNVLNAPMAELDAAMRERERLEEERTSAMFRLLGALDSCVARAGQPS